MKCSTTVVASILVLCLVGNDAAKCKPSATTPTQEITTAPPTGGPTTAPTKAPTRAPTSTPISTPTVTPTPKPTASANDSKPSTGEAGFTRLIDEKTFKEMFPNAIPLYTFQGLVDAVKKYPKFGNTGDDTRDKREVAAFFAQTGHESANYQAAEEYAAKNFGPEHYCDESNQQYKCVPGKHYHGRGPIQLTWNYNYGACGKAIGVDLLNNPEKVGTDKSITWQTALWFWWSPHRAGKSIHDIMGQEDAFAESTLMINGGECGAHATANNKANEQSRVKRFKALCAKMGVDPGNKPSCNA